MTDKAMSEREALFRLHEIANRDTAVKVTVRADDLRALLAARASLAASAGQADHSIGVDCLTAIRKLMTRLGLVTNESVEGFGAEIEHHLYSLVRRANTFLDAASTPAAAQADVAADARRMRTLCRLLDAMDDIGNGFPGEVHMAFQDGAKRTREALDAAYQPSDN
jgi:hypothetical protein